MENLIKKAVYIIENSTLETSEKAKLLQFIEMVGKDAKDAENSVKAGKLPIKARSCFYKAYTDCIKHACVCYGIIDIEEQLVN